MKNTILAIVEDDRCAGCFACYTICSTKAIKIQLNTFGFYVPQINSGRCSGCGKCLQYCPVYVAEKNRQITAEVFKVTAYGAWSNDDVIRLKSSSGGVFSELAIAVLQEGGVVFGAGWNNQVLQHLAIDCIDELEKLRGSKYIPSYIGESYTEVVKYLESGKKVLFTGTPCQIAALQGLVKHKNLVTADLICHGVPSLLAFHKYIISKIGNKGIKEIIFRDKEYGWENYSIKMTTNDDQVYSSIFKYDPFLVGFLRNLYLNKICYNCPFSKLPRTGDITLGDYWGASEEIKDQKGISVILVNTIQGKAIIDKLVSENKITLINAELKTISERNIRLINGRYDIPPVREELLRQLIKSDFELIEKKFIKPPDQFLLKKISHKLTRKDIICFGTGSASKKILDFFTEKDVSLNIKYFVDNNRKKWGQSLASKKIYPPEILLGENSESIFIIVASSYYMEIQSQLEKMGFFEGVHFINGMDLIV